MISIAFYLVAAGLMVLGGLLLMNTSAYSRLGGTKYEKRRKRREIGIFLLIISVLILAMGLFAQFVGSNSVSSP
jgi:hypothetical protein